MKSIYPLDKILEPMKPSSVELDKASHVIKLEDALRDDSKYVVEEKIDGCRYFLIGDRFFSTRVSEKTGFPVEKTENFPHLVKTFAAAELNHIILDGEICIPGKKSQDVTTITGSLPDEAIRKQEEFGWVEYRVFDILRLPNGEWITDRPWFERRRLLENLFKTTYLSDTQYIKLNAVKFTAKKQHLDEIIASGAEGVVLKTIDGTYEVGKRPAWNWIKVKQTDTDDAVIMGFEPAVKEYTGTELDTWPYYIDGEPVTRLHYLGWIGAIVLGKYKNGELVRIGKCAGINDMWREKFSTNPEDYIGRVVQIKMMEKTNDGNYRHPSFVAIHPDKNAKECII